MKNCLLYLAVTLLLACGLKAAIAQEVPHHISNQGIYEFLEEMASIKAVQLNSVALPLSRGQIYSTLVAIGDSIHRLGSRQRLELGFYMQEFVKEDTAFRQTDYLGKGIGKGKVFPLKNREKRYDLFYYRDKIFQLSVNPIFGGTGFLSGKEFYYERQVGLSAFAAFGKNVSAYGELRSMAHTERLSGTTMLNQQMGASYKQRENEFSEARGGIIAHNRWGSLGILKDHIIWGNSYNGSNILSGRTPSFPMIRLQLHPVKWFSLEYFHAWLASDVVDSTATYSGGNGSRQVLRSKYMAANLFTVRPLKGLYVSFGNSVVYSDNFNAVYLIPFLFFKSVDHTLQGTGSNSNELGNNSQMFMQIMSRQLRYLQIYASVFVDELRIRTMFDENKQRNHWSWKVGGRFTAPGNINLSIVAEYTRSNPLVYRHFVNTTTYESSSYGLGHYLGDNADEIHLGIIYKPISRLHFRSSFTLVHKGTSNTYTTGSDGAGLPFLENESFTRWQVRSRLSYAIAQDVNVSVGYEYLKEDGPDAYKYLPNPYAGSPHHFHFGLSIGY